MLRDLATSRSEVIVAAPTHVKLPFPVKTLKMDTGALALVHGPTSIFDTVPLPRARVSNDLQAALRSDFRVTTCIKLFFQWQYPDMHTFVLREAFLGDFYDADSSCIYSSAELVHAVCCVGALMSLDHDIRAWAPRFYQLARDILDAKLEEPSISSLQAFLLLGLYDIYNGRVNTGWMLTGNAFRMGLGIGFHLKPENWSVQTNEAVSDITVSVRSRIFWGSFMADRFVSLMLGRPSILQAGDATIHVSANMPPIEWIGEYTYPGTQKGDKPSYIDVSNPLTHLIKLASISDDMMRDIFASVGPKQSQEMPSVLALKIRLVHEFNQRILEWRRQLPEQLQWDRALFVAKGHDITRMPLRYFYYLVILCLNRPFVELPRQANAASAQPHSLDICKEAILDVHAAMVSFIRHHGFRRCSILIIYLCIIAATIILRLCGKAFPFGSTEGTLILEFTSVLKYTSPTWQLSDISYKKLAATLRSQFNLNLDAVLSQYAMGMSGSPALAHGSVIVGSATADAQSTTSGATLAPESHDMIDTMNTDGFGGPPVFMTTDASLWVQMMDF